MIKKILKKKPYLLLQLQVCSKEQKFYKIKLK